MDINKQPNKTLTKEQVEVYDIVVGMIIKLLSGITISILLFMLTNAAINCTELDRIIAYLSGDVGVVSLAYVLFKHYFPKRES